MWPYISWHRLWYLHQLWHLSYNSTTTLRWRHNGRDDVPNHQPRDCLHNRLFTGRSKKTSKLRVTGLCAGNSPLTGEFPAQRASNAENISLWWRHHDSPLSHVLAGWYFPREESISLLFVKSFISVRFQPFSAFSIFFPFSCSSVSGPPSSSRAVESLSAWYLMLYIWSRYGSDIMMRGQ